MQTIKKIGIFDSGVGGLTVLKSLIEEIGFERIVYYGDTARVPYGNKDHETIIRFSLEALEFFKHFNLDLLVVACNTASAHALESMQKCTNMPIVGVIESGIKALQQKNISHDKHILVIATEATIKSGNYECSLRKLGYTNITSIPTNLFVGLVEENIYDHNVIDSVFKYYFKSDLKPDAIILGCTHFPLLLNELKQFFGKEVIFIHSGEAIANYLQNNFNIINNSNNKINFFASDNVIKLKDVAKKWLKNGTYIINDGQDISYF